MKKCLLLIVPIIILAGCQNKKSFTVKGTINDPIKKTITLSRLEINSPVFVDSSKISSNGTFMFKVKASEPDLYQIGYSGSDFITLLATPGEKIELVFPGSNLSASYSVSGSKGSEDIRMLDMRLTAAKRTLDSLGTILDEISLKDGMEERRTQVEDQYTETVKALRKKNIEYIITNTKSLASLKAAYQRIDENAYVLYEPRDLQYLKIISDSLSRYHPNSKTVKALSEDVKRELAQINTRQIQSLAAGSPEIKLDPNLKDTKGNRISLSSLRGRVVLLAFWSVESEVCIAENLELKQLYKKYKNQGFEIYQINVDQDEEKWKNEVRFDELPWISTREDDPSNPVNARLFNVTVLPANYLFDKDGNIIGKNLHGRALRIKLTQLFNN